MKKDLLQWYGWFGVLSFLSYTAAVVFAPLAYPGYRWTAQAVSDLSAANAPSLTLWQQLSCLYGVGGLICLMAVCAYLQGKLTRTLRPGIALFTAMQWIPQIGFTLFPLSESGYAGKLQDVMHLMTTAAVVLLSIAGLTLILVGGLRDRRWRSLSVWAAVALCMMFAGAVGTSLVPLSWFGVVERLSVFAAAGFNAVLGIFLWRGFPAQPYTHR